MLKKVPVQEAVGTRLAHDITEIRPGDGIVSVKPVKNLDIGLIITGSEVYNGLIEDKFAPLLSKKIIDLGSRSRILSWEYVPDDANRIQQDILKCLDSGCDLIILSGGMSVDPDDVTRVGIQKAGATEMYYGSAVLPGAMFLVAYINDIPLLGVPACGLFHRITILDLILPRVMAGEHIDKKELAFLGHGGLCMNCKECTFPHSPFGR